MSNPTFLRICATKSKLPASSSLTFLFAILLLHIPQIVRAQVTSSQASGSSNKLNVSLSNTMGVYTQINATPNVEANVSATLNIKPESRIQDNFGSGPQGELRGAVVVTPTSANIDLKGLRAQNDYIIDQGTQFNSTMKTLTGDQCTGQCASYNGSAIGTSSSGMTHNMSLTVDQITTTFSNSFSQNF